MPSVSLLLLFAVLSSLLVQSEGKVRGVSIPLEDLEGYEDITAQNHRNLQVPKAPPKAKAGLTGSLTYQRGGAAGRTSRSMTSRGSSKGMGSSDDDIPMCFVRSNTNMIGNLNFLDGASVTAQCPMESRPLSVSCELNMMGDGLALVTSIVGFDMVSDMGRTVQCGWVCLNNGGMGCLFMDSVQATAEARCCTGLFPIY